MCDFKLLDCTIRDGGYVNDWKFSDQQVRECYIACSKSNVDYMEIGFKNIKTDNFLKKFGKTYFCDENYINELIGDIDGCELAVMVTINEFNINDFVLKCNSKIRMVRVLMAYHGAKNGNDDILDIDQLINGVGQINQLIDLGYEVSFNIGRIDKISKQQLYEICEILSKTGIKYFTMADTYGTVDLNYIEWLLPYVNSLFKEFNSNIKLGFHAHDNMGNGTCKALQSLKYGASIIDGCILGFGRGSGNAKTELIMMDLNKNKNKNYELINILEYGDQHIINYKECTNNLCYNVVYAMSAYFGCHVSYAINIVEKCDKMNTREIYNIFKKLKEINKNMFYYEDIFKDIYHEEKINAIACSNI